MDYGRALSTQPDNLFRMGRLWFAVLWLAGCVASVLPASGGTMRADAVVLVNSTSAKYLDFQRWLQPYLDNFGVPYTVQDISTNIPSTSLTNFALIIIGHKQLDTNHTYLGSGAQASISYAVSNGVGLINF